MTTPEDPRLSDLATRLEADDPLIAGVASLAKHFGTVPVALVGLISPTHEIVAGHAGWAIRELPLESSFLPLIAGSPAPTVIEDLAADPRLASHPLVVNEPHIRFYAAFPIVTGQKVIGAIELFDRQPKKLNHIQLTALSNLAVHCRALLSSRADQLDREKKLAQVQILREEIKESNDRFRDLFDCVDDLILTMSVDGRLMHVNSAALDAFAAEDMESAPKSIFDVVHPELRDDFRKVFARVVATGKPERVETLFSTEAVQRFTVEGRLTPRLLDGKTVLVRVIFRDISERKRFEVELGRARDAALESARLKSQFLTNVSHEIRTPIHAIVGMLELLLGTKLDEDQTDFAKTALSSADELLAIINNILQMSKIESGSLSTTAADFDPHETVERVSEVMKIVAEDKGLSFEVSVDPELPAIMRGDVTALRQVLSNVVGNAVKFTESGGVRVSAKLEQETDTHQIVRFEVSDSGIGIPGDEIPRLFQAFHQVDGSVTRKYGGVGLGLATARHLVELMGGLMGVESEVLKGSTFWFSIPFEKRISERLAVSKSKLDLTGARVLVVDKNPTSRRIITHYLKSDLRMRCDTATGAPQALWLISSAAELGDPYNVAIFDLHMPVMHGIALANEIKSRPLTASTALVAMTSFGEEVDDEILREVGIAAYLSKPVELDELLDCLTLAMAKDMRPEPSAEAPPPRFMSEPSAAGGESKEARILLAEDNRLNQKLTSSQLQKLGYHVDVVSNGREVLEAVARQDYAVILMDCQMPEVDGYQASIEIRRREGKERKTRIIAMTAHALEGDREKCLAAGMDDYLSKPTREHDLADAISRWLPAHA